MGVYKEVDSLNDKELFQEYDKLLSSAKRMRKLLNKKEDRKYGQLRNVKKVVVVMNKDGGMAKSNRTAWEYI